MRAVNALWNVLESAKAYGDGLAHNALISQEESARCKKTTHVHICENVPPTGQRHHPLRSHHVLSLIHEGAGVLVFCGS